MLLLEWPGRGLVPPRTEPTDEFINNKCASLLYQFHFTVFFCHYKMLHVNYIPF